MSRLPAKAGFLGRRAATLSRGALGLWCGLWVLGAASAGEAEICHPDAVAPGAAGSTRTGVEYRLKLSDTDAKLSFGIKGSLPPTSQVKLIYHAVDVKAPPAANGEEPDHALRTGWQTYTQQDPQKGKFSTAGHWLPNDANPAGVVEHFADPDGEGYYTFTMPVSAFRAYDNKFGMFLCSELRVAEASSHEMWFGKTNMTAPNTWATYDWAWANRLKVSLGTLTVDRNHDGAFDAQDTPGKASPGALMLAGYGLANHPALHELIQVKIELLGQTQAERDLGWLRGKGTFALSALDVNHNNQPTSLVQFFQDAAGTQPLPAAPSWQVADTDNDGVEERTVPEYVYLRFWADMTVDVVAKRGGFTNDPNPVQVEVAVDRVRVTRLSNGLGAPDGVAAHEEVVPGYAYVNCMNGNLFFGAVAKTYDTPATGPDLSVAYNHLDGFSSVIGRGWRTNYDLHLFDDGGFDRDGNGTINRDDRQNGDLLGFVDETGRRHFFTLQKGATAADDKFTSDSCTGLKGAVVTILNETSPTERYQLNRHDNRLYFFGEAGYLSRIQDLHGKSLTVTPGTDSPTNVADAYNRSVILGNLGSRDALNGYELARWGFAYDDRQRLKTITVKNDDATPRRYADFTRGSDSLVWEVAYETKPATPPGTTPDPTAQDLNRVGTVTLPTVVELDPQDTNRKLTKSIPRHQTFTYNNTEVMKASASTTVKGPYGGPTPEQPDAPRWPQRTYAIATSADALSGTVTATDGTIAVTTTYTLDPTAPRHHSGIARGTHVVGMQYDKYGRLVHHQVGTQVRNWQYGTAGCGDSAWLLTSFSETVDDNGTATTSYTYWPATDGQQRNGRLKTVQGPRVATPRQFAYTDAGFAQTITTETGAVWTATAWKPTGLPTSVTPPAMNQHGAQPPLASDYDDQGRLLSATDAWGLTTAFAYDGLGRLKSQTPPNNVAETWQRDALGRQVQTKDSLGTITDTSYDAYGRQTRVKTTASDQPVYDLVTTYAYLPTDQRLEVETTRRDPAANDAVKLFVGRELQDVVEGLPRRTVAKHVLGADPDSPTECYTDYLYTPEGWLWKVGQPYAQGTTPDSSATVYAYDPAGRRTGVTTPEGRSTAWAYYPSGWLKSETDGAGHCTAHTYYADGLRRRTTNPKNDWTAWTYDADGQLNTVSHSLGGPTSNTYYAGGLPQTAVDVYGKVTQFDYDFADRTRTATYDPSGLNQAVTDTIGANGYRTQTVSPFGTATYSNHYGDGVAKDTSFVAGTPCGATHLTRNGLGVTLQQQTDRQANDTNPITTAQALDGRLQTVSTTTPANNVLRPGNAGITGETQSLTDSCTNQGKQNLTVTRRDAAGRVLQSTDGEGRCWIQTYNKDGQLIRRQTPDGQAEKTTEWTAEGLPQRVERVRTGTTDTLWSYTTYTYNELDQVTNETTTGAVASPRASTFRTRDYYPNGQLKSEKTPREAITFEYTANSRQLAWTHYQTRRYDEQQTYDAYGRPYQRKVWYADGSSRILQGEQFDAKGQLRSRTYTDGKTEEFRYTDDGRLLWLRQADWKWVKLITDWAGLLTARWYFNANGAEPPGDSETKSVETVTVNNAGATTRVEFGDAVDLPTDPRLRSKGVVLNANDPTPTAVQVNHNNADEETSVTRKVGGNTITIRQRNYDPTTGRVTSLTNNGAIAMNVNYDDLRGAVNGRSFGTDEYERQVTLDDLRRATAISQVIPGVGTQQETLSYNSAEQLRRVTGQLLRRGRSEKAYTLTMTYHPTLQLATELRTGYLPCYREYSYHLDGTRKKAILSDDANPAAEPFDPWPANATVIADAPLIQDRLDASSPQWTASTSGPGASIVFGKPSISGKAPTFTTTAGGQYAYLKRDCTTPPSGPIAGDFYFRIGSLPTGQTVTLATLNTPAGTTAALTLTNTNNTYTVGGWPYPSRLNSIVCAANDRVTVSAATWIPVAFAIPTVAGLGDLDANGTVNANDLQLVNDNLNRDYRPGTGPGDVNGDGVVDALDQQVISANLGCTAPATTTLSIGIVTPAGAGTSTITIDDVGFQSAWYVANSQLTTDLFPNGARPPYGRLDYTAAIPTGESRAAPVSITIAPDLSALTADNQSLETGLAVVLTASEPYTDRILGTVRVTRTAADTYTKALCLYRVQADGTKTYLGTQPASVPATAADFPLTLTLAVTPTSASVSDDSPNATTPCPLAAADLSPTVTPGNRFALETYGTAVSGPGKCAFDDLTWYTSHTRTVTYTYVPGGLLGQLQSATGSDGSQLDYTYTLLQQVAVCKITPPGGGNATQVAYAYDRLGRLTTIVKTRYKDANTLENNPLELHTFTYYASTWMRKTATLTTRKNPAKDTPPDPSTTVTTTQLWDGYHCVTQTTGTTTTDYAHFGLDAAWDVSGNTVRQPVTDASGNVTAWSTGNKLADDRRFDSFGNAYTGTAAATHYSNVGYRGQLHDRTGLIFLRNRYYDPTIGGFTQPDPIRSGTHWFAYPTDPVNQWDPMGLRTFLKVDDDARTVTMYMLVKYKPSKDLRLDSRQLTELARRHGQQVEKLFNEQNVVYADQYGHAPTVPNVVAERVTAFKGREAEEKLVELTRGTRKQYKGYTIRLSVVTTTDSNADEDLYDTFEIHPKIERENAGNLATNTTPEAVFHEYFHRLNLWDEYDRDKSDVHLDGSPKYKYNWLAEFKKNWKRAPEGDALMTCDGIKVYDRYVEAALFDLDNIEKGQRSWRTDKTHLLDKSDPYFDQARIENTEHRKIEDILKIIEGGSQPK